MQFLVTLFDKFTGSSLWVLDTLVEAAVLGMSSEINDFV